MHEANGKILEIQNITMKFGGLLAVNSFDNHIHQGEILGLIGPNGAGKTTVFNVLTGVYRPTKGKVLFKGIDITPYKPHVITHLGVARTFQNIRLFNDLTVLENVLVAQHHELTNRDGDHVLKKNQMKTYGASFIWFWKSVLKWGYYGKEKEMVAKGMLVLEKMGLDAHAHEKADSLPYGQQRKLEIARALAASPQLLLLDEPAAGMNASESFALMNLIRQIRDDFQITVLLIEHDMKVVMGVSERILVMDYGKIIAEGNPEKIQSDPAVIEAYLGEEWSNVNNQ